MIFERYAIEQVPYGANLILSLKNSNISNKITGAGIEFITSHLTNTSMTFSYTPTNGETLVAIESNLSTSINTKNKTFTLTDTATRKNSGQKPYIRLCCNNVKVPISFIDTDNTGNKWYESIINTNDIILKGWGNEHNQIKVSRYIIINWNKTQTQKLFLEKNTSNVNWEYYACKAQYFYKDDNNNIVEGNYRIWTDSTIPPNGEITIPRLDGVSSNFKAGNNTLTRKFYIYFILGVQVKISDGWASYQPATRYYIEGTNKVYDNTDFIKTISNKKYLKTNNNGFPSILSESELQFKWNSNFFFTAIDGDAEYYISPSSSKIYNSFGVFTGCESFCGVNCPDNSYCNCNSYEYSRNKICPSHQCDVYKYCNCNNFGDSDENYGCKTYKDCTDYRCMTYRYGDWTACDEHDGGILLTDYDKCECNKGYTNNTEYYDCYKYYEGSKKYYCPCYAFYEYLVDGKCIGYCLCNGNTNQEEFCPWWFCEDCDDCPDEGPSYCDPDTGGGGGGGTCPSDGTGSSQPWESEKKWVGGSGKAFGLIKIYDEPKGSHVASYREDDTFSVYYYWNGWFETIDGWIRADASWERYG